MGEFRVLRKGGTEPPGSSEDKVDKGTLNKK